MLIAMILLGLAVFFGIFKFIASELGFLAKLLGSAVLLLVLYIVGGMLLGAADLAVLFAAH